MSKWTFGWVLILFIDTIFALRGIAEKNPRTIRGVTIYKICALLHAAAFACALERLAE